MSFYNVQSAMIASRSAKEAARNVRTLYRQWQKSVPFVLKEYEIGELSVDECRRTSVLFVCAVLTYRVEKVREEFGKNRHVSDLNVIDALAFKGRSELQETLQHWKQKAHILRFFGSKAEGSSAWLDRFYAGKE